MPAPLGRRPIMSVPHAPWPRLDRDAIGKRNAEFLVGDEMIVVDAVIGIAATAETPSL